MPTILTVMCGNQTLEVLVCSSHKSWIICKFMFEDFVTKICLVLCLNG